MRCFLYFQNSDMYNTCAKKLAKLSAVKLLTARRPEGGRKNAQIRNHVHFKGRLRRSST